MPTEPVVVERWVLAELIQMAARSVRTLNDLQPIDAAQQALERK